MTDWLTYGELAERLGISPEAARQKALRGRWRRQQGNDGKARVLVDFDSPDAAHKPRKAKDERTDEQPDNTRTIAALEGHITTLKDMLAKAETLAEQRQGDADRERDRVTELTAEMLKMTGEMMAAAGERDQAKARTYELLAEMADLRNRPWWRRLFA